ncbi:endonuclease/exonuclease/phosphatase family protein [Nocardia brasiliensis]|uniref:endonuclease/exonuclease/phosphatase family protein n=1 Tax=Nocardia brasiliensis TaxID=37326 RepID=UPI0024573813|nr:endonuclease/exonuclease/phosphatase family protein [Nocardia brasiliensis]
MRLRIVTVNVQNREGDHRRLGLINQELRRLSPDLAALQEVVDSAHLDELLAGTELHGIHQSDAMAYTPPFSDRYGGNAVATRWPGEIVEVLDLRLAGAGDVPWCTVAAKVPLPQEGEVLFISATAAWRLDAEAVREQQAVALSDLDARHRTDLPTIIAGDFNAGPDAASIRYLTGRQSISGRSVHYHDAWEVAGAGPGHTWSADNANAAALFEQIVRQPGHRRRFDYVFTGSWHAHPKARCEIRAANLAFDQPTAGVWPSDHFGVVVDVEIGKDA